MRLPRSFFMVLFPACIIYYAAVADAALQGHHASAGPAGLSVLSLFIPRLPDAVMENVVRAVSDLRETIQASGLMTDTRPTPEQERRDLAALWADLEGPRPVVVTPSQPVGPADYPVLEPGQD